MRPSKTRVRKRKRRRNWGEEEGEDDDDDFDDDDDDNDGDDDDEPELEGLPKEGKEEEKLADTVDSNKPAPPSEATTEAVVPPPPAEATVGRSDAPGETIVKKEANAPDALPTIKEIKKEPEEDKGDDSSSVYATPEGGSEEIKYSKTKEFAENLKMYAKNADDKEGIKGVIKYEPRDRDDETEEEVIDDIDDVVPPPPPPPSEEKELLFLIEFMVDTMTIFPENLKTEGIDPCALTGATSIVLTFLHFPPMEINEKDIDSEKQTGFNVIQYKMGKSLMFALTESQFESPPPSVYLSVTATKDMPHAYWFPKMIIGRTKIQLTELFKQTFEKYDADVEKNTVSKSIKENFELIGEKNRPAAEVSIYIRLTCIGENLITEFQKGDDAEDLLLFRNEASRKMYECKTTQLPIVAPATIVPEWGSDKKKKVCEARHKKVPPPDPEDEDFEEIFAEINGSAIKIKVEKSKRKDAQKIYHVSDFCDCDIPLPPNLVAGLSELSLPAESNSSLQFDRSIKPVKPDPRVGLDPANQLVFQIPPAETLAQVGMKNDITYNVKSCRDCRRHGHSENNYYRITKDGTYEGNPPKMPNDPEKDVFILRIIKRGKKDQGKDVLNLEFRTPKEKIEQPKRPPYMKEMATGQEKSKKKKKKDKKKKK